MPRFIVISGKKQAGKTTAAKYMALQIRKKTLQKAILASFATPIKEFCRKVLLIPDEMMTGTDEEKNAPTEYLWDNLPMSIRERYSRRLTGEQLSARLSLTNKDVKIRDPKSGPMTAREVMQVFGTDVMRNFFHKDIWARLPFKQKHELLGFPADVVIIDDCRFPNEAEAAREAGAVLIRLTRDVSPDDHLSEKAMDDYPVSKYNHVIPNHSFNTIVELCDAVDLILEAEGFYDED